MVPYLAALGVSHLYSSPLLQAAPGSSHGYDVVDPLRINAELGGEAGFSRLRGRLSAHGLGLVLDIVPNHMATAGRHNPWWWDLLEKGRKSPYGDFFDVNWHPATSSLEGKVLLGILEDRYGREVDAGRLRLERLDGELVVRYQGQDLPVAAGSSDPELEELAMAGDADALDTFLQRQHYRLVYHRTAQEELNYRRFFTVDSLIGLRMERDEVFRESHRLTLRLVAEGAVQGLRVDHVDGLRDPIGYLRRLRGAAPSAYLVVEKVLAADEELRPSLPVDGTTGYEFMNLVGGLFVEPRNEEAMSALYHAFTGEPLPFSEVARNAKLEVMETELAPDLERLTTILVAVCEGYRRHRDWTRRELKAPVRELAAAFGVYRTYGSPGEVGEEDRRRVAEAANEAGRRMPAIEPELLQFVSELLLFQHPGERERDFAERFQQFTPAVMAKGVEDTAFYRYNRLVSLNEVGWDPGVFGVGPEAFHLSSARTARTRPQTMLTLSTHDTKRSADVRARLSLLSEMPLAWGEAVRRWAERNERYRSQGYPDRNLEYLLYQTLVGAWPIDLERLTAFLLKAAREAKQQTSWVDPSPAYEEALKQFAANLLADPEFLADLEEFIGRHQLVSLGRTTSLSQTTLLLTSPGVPDIYQGTEVWDLSLVDPDNRRPVDFESRHALLREVLDLGPEEVLARSDEGAPKLWLIARLLRLRAERPALFASSTWEALPLSGQKARHAVAFSRGAMAVLVPRLLVGLEGEWGETEALLPPGDWVEVLSGRRHRGGSAVSVRQIVSSFPVAVLIREA